MKTIGKQEVYMPTTVADLNVQFEATSLIMKGLTYE